MTYFEDLSPYQYFRSHELPHIRTVNVGWLARDKPFPVGETSSAFRINLLRFCQDEYVVHIARGFHVCEFCDLPADRWYRERQMPVESHTHWLSIGDGEIRVAGKTLVYAAPTLIYHYVVDHHYSPPQEFLDAVLNPVASPGSPAFIALLQDYQQG